MTALSSTSVEYTELHKASFCYPAIDNHAHPLLKAQHRSALPFEGLISEAQDDAITDSIHTLACFRATAQLGRLYNLSPAEEGEEVSWDDVKSSRDKVDYFDLCRTCFQPTQIQCILIDDGLGGVKELAENYRWHDQLTHSPTKRVVRIETLAEDILKHTFTPERLSLHSASRWDSLLQPFKEELVTRLLSYGASDEVVAFKSIACYRTGLDISDVSSAESIASDINEIMETYKAKSPIRLAHKALNNYVVHTALQVAGQFNKPVQFHTGLGDNDIDVTRSSPSHLQPIIKAYPNTTFVLLHASYPFTREAAYLTSVYRNVYLDFGEIFPLVSGDGQRDTIRQMLELCPTNKIMWSTDGHWWPETYYLGSIQAREALYEVLAQSVNHRELTENQAVLIVQNALFHNANRVYKLNLEPRIVHSC